MLNNFFKSLTNVLAFRRKTLIIRLSYIKEEKYKLMSKKLEPQNDYLTMNYDAKHLAISCERISSKKPDLKNVQNAEQIILGKCKNREN